MSDGRLLHCAYCGDPIRYLGSEQAEAFIRHYYSCPHCGRVWTLSPAGHLEASASGLSGTSDAARASGSATPQAGERDQA